MADRDEDFQLGDDETGVVNATDLIDPIDVALAAMTGLCANPAFGESPMVAASVAWTCVDAFYDGLAQYHQRLQVAQRLAEIQAASGADQPFQVPMAAPAAGGRIKPERPRKQRRGAN